jgi:niacin transporter
MVNTKKMVITALLIAVGIVLPIAFHSVPNGGRMFLPMHIPVFLAGIICGFPYGLACGVITPLLSHLFTQMPPSFMLPSMVCELAAYGTVSALLMRFIRPKKLYIRLYIALIGAMLFGRIFYGVLNALILNVGEYSMQIWLTAAFINAIPGIIIQIAAIPPIVLGLKKAKLIEIQ